MNRSIPASDGTFQDREGQTVTPSPDSGMTGRDYSLPVMLNITTPKNTPIADYLATYITLPIGRINKIWIEFPKGCAGLVGLQMWRGADQRFPIPPGQWMTGDNFLIPLGYTLILYTEPLTIEIRTYNLDDTYDHRIMIILEMSGLVEKVSDRLGAFLKTLAGE